MADTFNSLLTSPWIGVRFLLKIQGIGDVFLDGPTPVKQSGTNWSVLPDSGPGSFAYREDLLDVSVGGLQDIGQQISRSEGHTSPGQMSITLMDNRLGYLRDLFAKDLDSMVSAQLSDSVDLAHDTTGAGTVVACSAAITGWPATGYAYLGRETIYYPVIDGSNFGTVGNKCARDVYSIGHCDTSYTGNVNANKAPRVITSKPTVWHGRYVQLYCYLVDREGRTIANNLDTMSREVFRGVIQGVPVPDQSYSRYVLNCRSIDSVLHTSVGLEPVEGELIRVIGTKAENSAGNPYDFDGADDWLKMFYLSDSTRYLHLKLTRGPLGSTDQHEYVLDILDGLASVGGAWFVSASYLMQIFDNELSDQIQDEADFDDVSIKLQKIGKKKKWSVTFHSTESSAYGGGVNALSWEIDWDEVGSIGPLLGMDGVDAATGIGWGSAYQSGENFLAGIIASTDTAIPFFYKATFGLVGLEPAATGYVRIGDEIIRYDEIVTTDAEKIDGLNVMVGCTRGVGGTTPEEHRIEYNADGQATGDAADVKFITYFGGSDGKGVSFFDIILQLAISTGSGHHYPGAPATNYDTLDQFVGPAIAPGHFDTGSFEHAKANLLDQEHKVTWWFDKPQKLMDLAAKWMKPLGLFLTGRVNDSGDYKIAVVETLPPLQADYTQQLVQANIDATAPASWTSQDQILNEVVVKYMWSVAEGKTTEDYICVRDTDSITDFGKKGRLEWELVGYQWDYATALQYAHNWAATVFARFGRPFDLLELETDRTGWLVRPGDSVLITMAGPPNTDDGTRVYNARVARVLAASNRYHAPGSQPGSKVTVIIEDVQRWASYVPSAAVRAVAGSTITLFDNEYTDAGLGDADVNHFDVGDYVQVFNRGDMDDVDLRTVISITGDDVVLSAGLTNVTFDATRTTMIGQVWDQPNLLTTQRDHVYLSVLADLGAGLNTTPFKYT